MGRTYGSLVILIVSFNGLKFVAIILSRGDASGALGVGVYFNFRAMEI
jgi:hypothetical protein